MRIFPRFVGRQVACVFYINICGLILTTSLLAQDEYSKHFSIHRLANGVYAAIATNGGHAICNAGIVDLGASTLIFDPFMTPAAAEDLKKAAFALTSHPVKYVINSHFHNDHVGGNQVFSGATIISTPRTRALIAEFLPEEIEWAKSHASGRLDLFRGMNRDSMSPHQVEENIMWVGYFEGLLESSEVLQVVLPEIGVTDTMMIESATRSVQLIVCGEGHTESDLILFLPEEKIIFTGDLLFVQNHPWLDDGNPDKLRITMDRLISLGAQTFVPGHGPIGTPDEIEVQRGYIDHIDHVAAAYHENKINPEELPVIPMPAPYDGWFLSRFYKPNIISEYKRLYHH